MKSRKLSTNSSVRSILSILQYNYRRGCRMKHGNSINVRSGSPLTSNTYHLSLVSFQSKQQLLLFIYEVRSIDTLFSQTMLTNRGTKERSKEVRSIMASCSCSFLLLVKMPTALANEINDAIHKPKLTLFKDQNFETALWVYKKRK